MQNWQWLVASECHRAGNECFSAGSLNVQNGPATVHWTSYSEIMSWSRMPPTRTGWRFGSPATLRVAADRPRSSSLGSLCFAQLLAFARMTISCRCRACRCKAARVSVAQGAPCVRASMLAASAVALARSTCGVPNDRVYRTAEAHDTFLLVLPTRLRGSVWIFAKISDHVKVRGVSAILKHRDAFPCMQLCRKLSPWSLGPWHGLT